MRETWQSRLDFLNRLGKTGGDTVEHNHALEFRRSDSYGVFTPFVFALLKVILPKVWRAGLATDAKT
jgi:hypothetical protein